MARFTTMAIRSARSRFREIISCDFSPEDGRTRKRSNFVSDPRVKTSDDDLGKQFELVTKLRDLLDQVNTAVLEIRDARAQIKALDKRLAADEASQPVRDAAKALNRT